MNIHNFFPTPIWTEVKKDFIISLNKSSNKYIKKSKSSKESKKWIKDHGDFGRSYHSDTLINDNDFFDFKNYITKKSLEYLDIFGCDMSLYNYTLSEFWVQEFAKKGGGHHSAHIHSNQHVSGFYFLKASDKTSYPVFHDPRIGARTTKLQSRNNKVLDNSEVINIKAIPGLLIIFPGYLQHEFSVDLGKEPFRFIHWNIQLNLKNV